MITVVGGPMFSGKTTWLIRHISHLTAGSFIVYKPDIDTRYGKSEYVTHDGKSFPAVNISSRNPCFTHLEKKVKTILLDELNFFSSDALLKAVIQQQKLGRDVVAAGLLFDYKKRPFGATLPLSKIADTFIHLYAKCDRCKRDAGHSYRKVAAKSQFLLGATESYGACCEECWSILQ